LREIGALAGEKAGGILRAEGVFALLKLSSAALFFMAIPSYHGKI